VFRYRQTFNNERRDAETFKLQLKAVAVRNELYFRKEGTVGMWVTFLNENDGISDAVSTANMHHSTGTKKVPH
jgi:hypothetical protein